MAAVPEVTAEFEWFAGEIIARYPVSKRSAALPLLHLWQETHGYVSGEGVRWIANRLELDPVNVLELVTFYPMFKQEPVGKVHIKICRTLSCMLAGSHELFEQFKQLTEARDGKDGCYTSPDGRFTIEFVECLADCANAPVVMVGDELHGRVDSAKAEQIVRENA